MHPPYLLIAMAAMSHAWLFAPSNPLAARSPWRTNLHRRDDNPSRGTLKPNGTLPNKQRTKTYCPKPDTSNGQNSVRLPTDTLGFVQAKALDNCTGQDIQNSVGGNNQGIKYGVSLDPGKPDDITGPYVQICSAVEQGERFNCDRDVLAHMLDEIACGDKDGPTQGYGVIVDDGQEKPEKYYVWYGPNDPEPCVSAEDFLKKNWDDKNYYPPPPDTNNNNNLPLTVPEGTP